MRVIVAESYGMCFGVRDALVKMREIEKPAEVTVFGQLVHNPAITREMERRGFVQVEEAERRAADSVRTPVVLITAHGVSDRERALLEGGGENWPQMNTNEHEDEGADRQMGGPGGRRIIDTTCPLVRKAHRAAVALARAGFFVVVIGKKGHVEVRGLTGDLPAGSYEVVENVAGVRNYRAARIGVMCQTTTVEREAREIVARVREENSAAEVRFVNTICMPTRQRQAALERLLEEVDVLVAVGGRESKNTRELVTRAREAGVRAVHVEGAEELCAEMFGAEEVVGLTAGTSTLAETVDLVRRRLEGFHTEYTEHTEDQCAERAK
jgi:4-hydroxy-3-methylbut-2-en-1-yl diphosphate reductase